MTVSMQVALLRARLVVRRCIRRAAEILRAAGFALAFAVSYLAALAKVAA